MVVWTSAGQDGHVNGIFAQRYDSNGTPVGIEFQVTTIALNNQSQAAVAATAEAAVAARAEALAEVRAALGRT